MPNIIFHSDDYGINSTSSRYILDCCDEGVLNSLSILPNSPHYASCCEMLSPYVEKQQLGISVHLNLVEGKSLSAPEELSLLTDSKGYFCHSFESLFFLSLTPQRSQLRQEIKHELFLQIQKIQNSFPDTKIALDSHQHFHMIPLVFEVVLEIIKEHELSLRYIRVSNEPLIPFITTPALYLRISPINIVKNILLKCFAWWNHSKLTQSGLSYNLFWGLMFSGDMNLTVVSTLMNKFQKIADRHGLPLEILSHPCPISQPQECLAPDKKGFVEFYTSQGRYNEAEMLKNIAACIDKH